MQALIVSLLALFATLAGGLCVLRFQGLPAQVLAFSAGTLLAIGVLDLIPYGVHQLGLLAPVATAAGYGILYLWHRTTHLLPVPHLHIQSHSLAADTGESGLVVALALLVHKFIDGLLLGVGVVGGGVFSLGIAVAVVVHSFCDGINTVTLVLRSGRGLLWVSSFLAASALLPLAATLCVGWLNIPPLILSGLLCAAAGTFLYIAIHDLLPAALGQPTENRLGTGGSFGCGILLTWVLLGWLGR